jgi:polysaccharide biosynthesis transport protein
MSDNSPSEVSLHFLDYWRVIRNRAPLICTIILLTLISGYVTTTYYMTKIYAAKVEIEVKKKDKAINVFDPSTDFMGFDPVYFQTQFEIIQSKKTLYKVIENLGLNKTYAKRFAKSETAWPLDQTYAVLSRQLEVNVKRGSNIMEITSYSDIPEETAVVANAIADAYIEARKGDDANKSKRGLGQLEEQIKSQEVNVKKARDYVEELRKSGNINLSGGQGSQTQLIEFELQRKQALRDQVKDDLNTRNTRLTELQKLPKEKMMDALTVFDQADGNLLSMRSQVLSLESELARLRNSGLGENHPDVQSRLASYTRMKEQVEGLVEGKIKALAIDVQVSKPIGAN